MERAAQKRKVDLLFLAHAIFALSAGSLAFIAPHVFEWFMVHHGESLTLRANSDAESKVTHLVIRLYGALILAQAWITWSARKCDAQIRRAMIQVSLAWLSNSRASLRRESARLGIKRSSRVECYVNDGFACCSFVLYEFSSTFTGLLYLEECNCHPLHFAGILVLFYLNGSCAHSSSGHSRRRPQWLELDKYSTFRSSGTMLCVVRIF